MGDELGGVRAGLLCPVDQAFGCPFGVLAVGPRHVLGDGGMSSLKVGAPV